MQLDNVPNNTLIRVPLESVNNTPPAHRPFVEGETLMFMHCDGMYSLCFDADGRTVHLSRFAEVEIVEA